MSANQGTLSFILTTDEICLSKNCDMSDPSLPTPFNQHRPTPPPEEIGTFQSISGSPSIPTLGRRKDDDSESIFHKVQLL